MEKKQLRQELRHCLTAFAQQPMEKLRLERLISEKLFQTEVWQKAQVVATTKNMAFEFSTQYLMETAWRSGKKVVLPVTYDQRQMAFFEVFPTTVYESTKFGVLEPVGCEKIASSQIDLCVVPGLVFRKDGYRVGFGGGFYDVFLQNFSGETLSLAFPFQLREDWQPEAEDQPVKQVLSCALA